MATLVNGNGNPAVYAQQDADLYVGVMGTTSCIMSVGSKFAATIETANLISVADGVILTKEGRRIQTDVGEVDEFNIPNGAAGVTRYYIIGYHLYTDGQGSQKCETFVQLMSSATDTIPEAEFRNGATEVYVSLYRVTQVGLTLNNPESLLPDALNLGDINASLTELDQKIDNSLTLRYNQSTDWIQAYLNGEWVNWKFAALQSRYLIKDGVFIDDALNPSPGIKYSPATSVFAWQYDRENGTLTGRRFTSSENYGDVCSTSETISIQGYTKLKAVVNGTTYSENIPSSLPTNVYLVLQTYSNQFCYIGFSDSLDYNHREHDLLTITPSSASSYVVTDVWLE